MIRRDATSAHGRYLLVTVAVLMWAMPAVADDAPAGRQADRGASPLAALAWMAGSWSGARDGQTSEEHWTDPGGGLMLGMNRAIRGDRAVMFEFLRIVARGDSIAYVALPRGRNETAFPLKELSGTRVVFENPDHDFPQRITYWQPRPGELSARVSGMVDGREVAEEWTWRRIRPGR